MGKKRGYQDAKRESAERSKWLTGESVKTRRNGYGVDRHAKRGGFRR